MIKLLLLELNVMCHGAVQSSSLQTGVMNPAVRIVVETDLLSHVQQSWQPTTALVCSDWKRAHEERGIAMKALPDDTCKLRRAIDGGMPLTVEAVATVCDPKRFDEIYSSYQQHHDDTCSIEEHDDDSTCAIEAHEEGIEAIQDHLFEVHQILMKYADIATEKGLKLYEEFYFHHINCECEWDFERGSIENIMHFRLLEDGEPWQETLTYDLVAVARAVSRIGCMHTLETFLRMFTVSTCGCECYLRIYGDRSEECDCGNPMRKKFAELVLQRTESDTMRKWAQGVVLG